jgi:hypothetical protein
MECRGGRDDESRRNLDRTGLADVMRANGRHLNGQVASAGVEGDVGYSFATLI